MNRFKSSETSLWILSKVTCPKCDKLSFAEYNKDLMPLKVFACEREGCTFWHYNKSVSAFYYDEPENKDLVEKCKSLEDYFLLREELI